MGLLHLPSSLLEDILSRVSDSEQEVGALPTTDAHNEPVPAFLGDVVHCSCTDAYLARQVDGFPIQSGPVWAVPDNARLAGGVLRRSLATTAGRLTSVELSG